MKRLRVKLFRHGDCDDDVFLRGITDSELSELGEQQLNTQLNRCFNQLDEKSSLEIVSSPLLRCKKLSEDFSKLNSVPFSTNERFQEKDFGDWDGKTYQQIQSQYPTLLDSYLKNPFQTKLPNSPSYKAFKAKIRQGWVGVIEKQLLNNTNKELWLVTHGGVVRVLLAYILKMDDNAFFNLKIDTGCVVTIDCFEHSCEYNDDSLFFQLVAIEPYLECGKLDELY